MQELVQCTRSQVCCILCRQSARVLGVVISTCNSLRLKSCSRRLWLFIDLLSCSVSDSNHDQKILPEVPKRTWLLDIMEEWVIELGFKASEIFLLYYPRHGEVKLGLIAVLLQAKEIEVVFLANVWQDLKLSLCVMECLWSGPWRRGRWLFGKAQYLCCLSRRLL